MTFVTAKNRVCVGSGGGDSNGPETGEAEEEESDEKSDDDLVDLDDNNSHEGLRNCKGEVDGDDEEISIDTLF